jgi:hypothetical protein
LGVYDSRGLFQYNATAYVSSDVYVSLNLNRATAGGFSSAPSGQFPNKPYGLKMRGVWGITSDGLNRMWLPIADDSNALFTDVSGVFTVNGIEYTVQSATAEKFTARS